MGKQSKEPKLTLDEVKETCPAFAEGCPYAHEEVITSPGADLSKLKECPAFNSGCPFKGAKNMDELQTALKSIPGSHVLDEAGGSKKEKLVAALGMVHQVSTAKKDEFGECPVFAQDAGGCIFKKTVCSDGFALLPKLDMRSWGLIIGDESEAGGDDHQEAVDRGLARLLKLGTAKAHRAAESVGFVRSFLRGRVREDVYAFFLCCLYLVYDRLEEQARAAAGDPVYGPLHFPRKLERAGSLKTDLSYFYPNHKELDEALRLARQCTPVQIYTKQLAELEEPSVSSVKKKKKKKK